MNESQNYKNVTLTQLGQMFGVTAQRVGKWLVEIGLRTQDKKPSEQALYGDFCDHAPLQNCDGYFWVWNKSKTIQALEAAGHRRIAEETVQSGEESLVGPFTSRQSSTNGYEIVGGDGTVAIWVTGKRNASVVEGLLNLAYKNNVLE